MRKKFNVVLIMVSLLVITGCRKTAEDQEKLRIKVVGYLEQMAEIVKREGWPVAVAQKLSKIGRPAVPILLEVVEDTDRDLVMRMQAAGFFIQPKFAKHPEVVPCAIQMLKTSDETGKKLAATILGHTEDKRAVEPLIEALENCKDKEVIRVTTQALGKIGDERAVEPLVNALGDKETKGVIIGALGKIGGEKAIEASIMTLKKDEDEIIRILSVEALVRIGDKKAIPALEEALEDSYRGVRRDAAKALKKLTGRNYEYKD